MAGGGQQIGNALVKTGIGFGGRVPQTGGPTTIGYVAPTQLTQAPAYQPTQTAPQISPFAQQMMQRSMAPQPIMGLPAALMQMQGRLNQPMMRGPMTTYQNPALAYRPNMAPAQEALNRVQPSVYKTDLDAARARIAELEAAQQPQNNDNYWMYNQG